MNQNIEGHKIEGLRELYQTSPAAREIFKWAAGRTNDAAETNLDRIVQKAQVIYSESVKFARKIDELGCGVFVVGRKSAKSRIRWTYSLKSMGQAAQGQTDNLAELDPDVAEDVVDQQPVAAIENAADVPITISEAKRQLALAFGVKPEAVDITIRG